MSLFTFTFTGPPASISPATFPEPPDTILPTFTFDHPDSSPSRPPSWVVGLIIGILGFLVLMVAVAVLCCCRRRSLTPQPPPVVLPPVPMTEIQMQRLMARRP
ncbi:hypothetical protein A2U01_0026402 [Trifolium medium]|uniref:Uncharacterized protein n=1 Tax=Trifolium medium TaxID=97028 RepID=A0A392P1H5_9FABA|nr:hypothetical protein [Trifolium medium]